MKIKFSVEKEPIDEQMDAAGAAPVQKPNILWVILAIAIALCGGYTLLTNNIEHIEDTNGPDNYALTTITDENIIKQDIGAKNLSMVTGIFNPLNSGVTFKSDKFTGVYRILVTNLLFGSDFDMDIAGFWVNGGNFRMCIVNNDEIIADVEPGMLVDVTLSDLSGTVELVVAGESADFEFTLDRMFCEHYGIIKED